MEFKDALKILADRAGVELVPQAPTDKDRRQAVDRLTDLLDAAADYFHQLLLHAPQAEQARNYVARRGLSDETVADFKLGYALDSWDACRNHFKMQGYGDDDLLEAGLLTHHEEKDTRYDRFRHRLMIPIHDVTGRIAGFGARTLDPDGIPKYLNSPQTTVFDKSHLLFGLDRAKRHIREARQVVIVEGYMDVMQAWQAGFYNVVAQMGTALTEAQLRLLKRYTKQFVLALDADAAGAQATLRGLELAREVLDRETDIRFDARGLIRHEGRLRADIRIVTLPEGKDPDAIIHAEPDLWPQLISQAKPIVAYVIDIMTDGLNMDDAKAKAAAAEQVLPLISDVVDPIEREHYRQLLARRLQVDERILHRVGFPTTKRRSTSSVPATVSAHHAEGAGEDARTTSLAAVMRGKSLASEMRRADFLRQCLTYPQIIAQIDKQLAANQQSVVKESDFTRLEDKALWQQLRLRQDSWAVATIDDLWDSLEDEFLRERIQTLLDLPVTPLSEIERLPDRLVLSVLDWRLEYVKGLIGEVEKLFRDSQAQDNPGMLELYSQQLRELPQLMLSLNKARGAISATGRQNMEDHRSYHH